MFAFTIFWWFNSIAIGLAQCPSITNSSYNTNCQNPNPPCTICANQTIVLSATGNNLPNGSCIKWYYSNIPGFNPYNGDGTYFGCGSINNGIISDVVFTPIQDMCNSTIFIVGIIDQADLQGCPGVYTTSFSFNITCPFATIDYNTPVCSGFLQLSSSGGLTYHWEGPQGFSSDTQNPFVLFLDPAQGGIYSVTVTDANGCISVKSIDVPPYTQIHVELDPPFNQYLEICEGGSITLTMLDYYGGSGNYINQGWYYQGNLISTDSSITVSLPGDYFYWVYDAMFGCGLAAFRTLHVIDSLDITIDPHPSHICNGGTISETANVGNGLGPYEYLWNTGETSQTIQINNYGVFTVTVTDVKGCTGTKKINIAQGIPLDVEIKPKIDIYCPGTNNIINSTASGGINPYTYSWITPTGGYNTSQVSVIAEGTYTVSVVDKVGCSGTATLNVKQNPELILKISPESPYICNNGSVQLSAQATGGSGLNYKYVWTTPSSQNFSGPVITTIEAGTFKVTVTDSQGCTQEASVYVTPVSELEIEINPNPAEFCPGGFVILNSYVVGGNGNYSYQWSTPKGNLNENPITADLFGFYEITITDSNGCKGNTEIEVSKKEDLVISILPGSVNICDGDSIMLKVSTAESGKLNYIWTTPLGSINSDSILAKEAGNYSVTVTSSNGCSGTSNININNHAIPSVSISPKPALLCIGDSILLTPITKDTDIIDFNWITQTKVISAKTIFVTSPDHYILKASNLFGCISFDSVTVVSGTELKVKIIPDKPGFCVGDSVKLTAFSPDTGNLKYTWFTPAGIKHGAIIYADVSGKYVVSVNNLNACQNLDTINVVQYDSISVTIYPNSASFCKGYSTNLNAVTLSNNIVSYEWITPKDSISGKEILADVEGNYTVVIANDLGCTASTSISVAETKNLIVDIIPSNPGFCTGNSVELSAIAIGSKLNYLWSLPGGVISYNQKINASVSGNYFVTVTDEAGCTGIASITVQEYSGLNIKIDPDPASFCNAGSVILTAINTNGTAPFYYIWNTPGKNETTNSINANITGAYSVTVTDNNGCTGTATTSVSQSSSLNVNIIPASPGICPGKSIDLSLKINGGQMPYNYSWNTPTGISNKPIINTSIAGIYLITVTDANSCTGEDIIEIKAYSDPQIDLASNLGFCLGSNVLIKPIINESQFPISFNWNTPIGNANLDSLLVNTPGNYKLTVTNSVGCSAYDSINIQEWQIPFIKYSPYPVEFCYGKSVTVNADATIGLAPFEFSWQGPTSIFSGNQIIITEPGKYTFTVTDSHGCTSSNELNAIELPDISVSIFTDPDILCETLPFKVLSKINGGNQPFNYKWLIPSGTATTDNVISKEFGNYTLIVTDLKGCSGKDSIFVKPDSLAVVLDKTDPGCLALKAGSINLLSANNPSFPMSLVVNNSPPVLISTLPYLLKSLSAGDYQINITGNNGCKQVINLELSEPSIPELKLGEDVTIFLGESYNITPIANFIIDSIRWTSISSLICSPGCLDPIAKPTVNTTYKATAYSKDGCKAIDEINIYVVEKESVYVPNSFSPNGDGINDKFIIFTDNSVKQIKKLYIYDRWGESVFLQNNFPPNDPDYGWNGRFREQYLNTSVFVYYLQVEFNDGRIKEFKGDINLIR